MLRLFLCGKEGGRLEEADSEIIRKSMENVAFGLCDWKRVCWKGIVLYSKEEYGIIRSKKDLEDILNVPNMEEIQWQLKTMQI